MRYFIDADDFGRTDTRTAAIDELMQKGLIQRASLRVNLGGSDRAIRCAIEHGYQDKVCFHLNLSEGRPLTDEIRKTGLCNKAGEFCWAGSKRILAACMSPAAIKAIRMECEAQMRLFRENGFRSGHMDSHDWILFNLPVWLAVKPLLSAYGFTTTRLACESWIGRRPAMLQKYYRFMTRQIRKGIRMEETWSGGLRSLQKADSGGGIKPETVAEIITHPDTVDGAIIERCNGEHIPIETFTAELSLYGLPVEDYTCR